MFSFSDPRQAPRTFTLGVAAVVLALVGGLLVPPAFDPLGGRIGLLPVHLLMELATVFIALQIVSIGGQAADAKHSDSANVLSYGFLVLAACELLHALTYEGMPALIVAASTPRAIYYWLVGRTFQLATFCLLALDVRIPGPRRWFLLAGIATSALVFWFGTTGLEMLPVTFVPGIGVTAFKARFEYLLSAGYVAVSVAFWRQARARAKPQRYALSLATLLIGAGELFFTGYVRTSDFQNLYGHVFLILASALLYRAKFVTAVHAPHEIAHQTRRSLEATLAALPDMLYELDARGTYLSVRASDPALLATLVEHFVGRQVDEMLPPESARIVMQSLQDAAREGRVGHRIIWREIAGRRHWFELSVARKQGPDAAQDTFIVIARDITDRMQAESRLRITASVFEAAHEGIVITGPDARILDVNPAFLRITGYGREEVIGQRPSILSSGRQGKEFYRAMWDRLAQAGTWSGEIVNRRRNGEVYTEHLDVIGVPDGTGGVKHYIGIFSDITAIKEHENELRRIAHHDALTGLPNRLLLTERLSAAIERARAGSSRIAVLYLDLDGFKPVNDHHGHEAGDRVLSEIAARLSSSLRAGDTLARMGGDEFVALLVDVKDTQECEAAARRLLDSISLPVSLDEHAIALSASIGISRYPEDGTEDADLLLRNADQAMYMAKAAGRNQFVLYHRDAPYGGRANVALVHDLRRALQEEQIFVHYQPIVDMRTRQVAGAEALVRWRHPERGLVPPSEFIPAAEATGLIHAIGDKVFEQAARVARTWNEYSLATGEREPRRIAVNRSPRQFFHRGGIEPWLRHLEREGIPGQWLTVEITEGLLLDDRPQVHEQLERLHLAGLTIALDDFGTGYSALSYLKRFSIDYLKIDRSFVRDITQDPSDRAIVEAIIVMARRLGLRLVAEGVETEAQADLLASVGCDLAQGYFYARPMPEAEFLSCVLEARTLEPR